jgi:RimJ/RimL family protein N-acetyltransferase
VASRAADADAAAEPTPPVLETVRLVGRPISHEDFAVLSVLHHDPRVMATLGGIRSDEETRRFLDEKVGHWERNGFGMWMFFARDDSRFVGRGGLQRIEIEGVPEVEIGYTVRAEEHGRGFGTEMARALVEVDAPRHGLDDLVSFTLPTNTASQRVMEKAGFTFERAIHHAGHEQVLYRRRISASAASPPA